MANDRFDIGDQVWQTLWSREVLVAELERLDHDDPKHWVRSDDPTAVASSGVMPCGIHTACGIPVVGMRTSVAQSGDVLTCLECQVQWAAHRLAEENDIEWDSGDLKIEFGSASSQAASRLFKL